MVCESRKQRKSGGTVSINGVRFEIPSRFHHIPQLYLSFTNWDIGLLVFTPAEHTILIIEGLNSIVQAAKAKARGI